MTSSEQRTPGRLVVVSYICLVVWGISWISGLEGLCMLAGMAVLPLLLAAIAIRLTQRASPP